MLLPTSVRARLTLWYTVVLGVPLVAFAVISYLIFSRTLHSRTDAFIGDALTVFANEVESEHRTVISPVDAVRKTASEVRFSDLDIATLDARGGIVAVSAVGNRTDGPPHAFQADSSVILAAIRAGDGRGAPRTVYGRAGGYRAFVRPLPIDSQVFTLAGVYPLAEVEATLNRIRQLFFVAIPILLVAAATGGSFLARRSFKPVTSMAARAAEIGATTLHERLPVATDDELGALARVLNELLDRLERVLAQQRRFMADASHELRTPAAILRAEADVTLSRDHRSEEEYRDSMTIVQDASRRLTRIVDDIFLLARADAGHLVMHPGSLYLDDLVHDAVRAVRPIADKRDVRVELGDAAEAPFHGDEDLLGRVVLNVLDNAIKHSPPGGTIDVSLARRGERYEIAVVDAGPGIPADAHERIFERFFRADVARSRAENTVTSGAGLGLAIGRRIAEMHNGQLTLAGSRPGRTEFRLSLPAAAVGSTP